MDVRHFLVPGNLPFGKITGCLLDLGDSCFFVPFPSKILDTLTVADALHGLGIQRDPLIIEKASLIKKTLFHHQINTAIDSIVQEGTLHRKTKDHRVKRTFAVLFLGYRVSIFPCFDGSNYTPSIINLQSLRRFFIKFFQFLMEGLIAIAIGIFCKGLTSLGLFFAG